MPVAIWVLGAAIFAQGTSELMLAGLLPELSSDFAVSIPQAGLTVSVFALGMLVGAPILAMCTLRWPRRRALLAFLGVFVIAHVVCAVTDSYAVLLGTRFVAAFVYAGFWAVGASTAMALVSPDRRGRAMSVVAGGITVAMVVGLPTGTWIGQHFGWRAAVCVVTVLTLIAAGAVLAAVPDTRSQTVLRIRDEVRGVAVPRLWLSYGLTATSTAALLGTFTYLSAMLISNTGLHADWVPLVLLGYGFGSLVGMAGGGHAADRWPRGVLAAGFGILTVVLVLVALTAHVAAAVAGLAIVLGFAGFGTNPALNSRVFGIAPAAPTLAPAGNISAFNVGISAGPWLAGVALTAGLGYSAVPWIGAGLGVCAFGLLVLDVLVSRSQRRAPERVDAHAAEAVACR